MDNDLFTATEVSTSALRQLFETAFYDVVEEEEGELTVDDNLPIHVRIPENNSYIQFSVGFRTRGGTDAALARNFCKKVNDELLFLRASARDDGAVLDFDWYIPVRGGIGRATVVKAFRMFIYSITTLEKFDSEDILG